MSNIGQLKREGVADRVTWSFGSDALPLRSEREVQAAREYARVAMKGNAEIVADAVRYDHERTAELVERLIELDRAPSTDDATFRAAFKAAIAEHIHVIAARPAAQCEANGWPT